jgi:transcription antitermination protein NusB
MAQLPARKLREIIVQILFTFEMGGQEKEELIAVLMDEVKVARTYLLAAFEKAEIVWSKKDIIDDKIASCSHAYDISRIGKVEKSILRLCIFELLFEGLLELEILIDEGVRLSKKFSTIDGGHFVHAVFDAVSKSSLSA